ncbi:LegC family aminotransferase [Cohnella pontilimi]|uniref:LegC family aminotransferase n=1 Tax=Cohnella pontilimi TaxID=2564100 RepID=A0A4V6WEG9_9BACL|nr:LegC family aminotransferase [Cohnella pontilimi]TJY41959.1 LegC family aminotransferase [Cohnella pontilimi]
MSADPFHQADVVVAAIRNAIEGNPQLAALHQPEFRGNEWEYVKDCLDTGWVSSAGKYVEAFEARLAEYTGSKYAVAVVNGTAALHICLLLAGVNAGDEVIVPSLTFVASANAVSYCGAIPHFADVSEVTLGIDVNKLEQYLSDIVINRDKQSFNRHTGRPIKAVVPMHSFGHPVDLEPIVQLCERFNLVLVEDAAESLGSWYKGRHTGTFGRLAALSFNGNKIVTTGGGGAILTQDESLARQAKHLTTTAKLPHAWNFDHDQIGYNYRMPNLNAALGYGQLERLPSFLNRKRELTARYFGEFAKVPGIRLFIEPEFAQSNYWLQVLMLDSPDIGLRNEILRRTNESGLMTRPVWTPMHKLKIYESSPSMPLPVTEELAKRIINIPSSPNCAGEE